MNGKPFAGIYGVAQKDPYGERLISIYETKRSCEVEPDEGRSLPTAAPWQAGFAMDFAHELPEEGRTATFSTRAHGQPTLNVIAVDGRVEIVEAPTTPGAVGKVRLRARATQTDGAVGAVEGEVAVEFCD